MSRVRQSLRAQMEREGLITVREGEELTRFDVSTIRKWIDAGEVKAERWGGRWCIKRDSLLRRAARVTS